MSKPKKVVKPSVDERLVMAVEDLDETVALLVDENEHMVERVNELEVDMRELELIRKDVVRLEQLVAVLRANVNDVQHYGSYGATVGTGGVGSVTYTTTAPSEPWYKRVFGKG